MTIKQSDTQTTDKPTGDTIVDLPTLLRWLHVYDKKSATAIIDPIQPWYLRWWRWSYRLRR